MSVYLPGDIHLSMDDTVSKALSELQVKQNDTMRLVLCRERKDMTPKEVLVEEFAIQSVNQLAAEAVIVDVWRAFKYRINPITENYWMNEGTRDRQKFRMFTSPTSFICKSAELWNNMRAQHRAMRILHRGAGAEVAKVAKIPPIYIYHHAIVIFQVILI